MPKGTFIEGAALLLVCHPDTPVPAVRCIEASAARSSPGDLTLRFRLEFRLDGDLGGLLIPQRVAPERSDGLWQHTCFEAFVAGSSERSYLEFNFSPSGKWAAYAFSDYRQRDSALDPTGTPKIRVDRDRDSLGLAAFISIDDLATKMRQSALNLGLSAVIEHIESGEGRLNYWALRHPSAHPAAKPDFHQRDTFVLTLPPRTFSHFPR